MSRLILTKHTIERDKQIWIDRRKKSPFMSNWLCVNVLAYRIQCGVWPMHRKAIPGDDVVSYTAMFVQIGAILERIPKNKEDTKRQGTQKHRDQKLSPRKRRQPVQYGCKR